MSSVATARKRLIWSFSSLVVALAIAAALVVALTGAAQSTAAPAPDPEVVKAETLSRSAGLIPDAGPLGVARPALPEAVEPKSAESASQAVTAKVPLAPGLNTAASLPWDRQGMGGAVPQEDIWRLVEANIARDWMYYATTNSLTENERAIVATIPSWPGVRPLERLYGPWVKAILEGHPEIVAKDIPQLFVDTNGRAVPVKPEN